MRHVISAVALALGAAPALAQAPAPMPEATATPAPAAAAHAAYSVETTDLGTLLDDPAAKAVLQAHMPALVGNAQIDMARPMTLKQMQQYAGDQLTDETLAKIQTDLSALPHH